MNKGAVLIVCVLMVAGAIFNGCSKSPAGGDGGSGDANKDFKTGMLTNYADNMIIPAYTDLQSKLDLLDASVNTFLAAPAIGTQQSLKTNFHKCICQFPGS